MHLKELRARVALGEDLHTEFKRKAAFPDKIMKEVVAFANAEGGLLLVGVDDNRTIPGVRSAAEEAYVLEAAIQRYCTPAIDYQMEIVPVGADRQVLALHIRPGAERPYRVQLSPDQAPGRAYVRVADRSVQASREVRQILRQQTTDKPFRFEYGEKERVLMRYLQDHPGITLEAFRQVAQISVRQASRTLVLLVLAGLLRVVPGEKEDLYMVRAT